MTNSGGNVESLPDWSIIPSGGVVIVLVWFIIRILNQITGTQESNQKVLTASRKSHEESVKELKARHKEEIEVFEVRLSNLDSQLMESRKNEQELRRRLWETEDKVAEYRRRLEIPSGPT